MSTASIFLSEALEGSLEADSAKFDKKKSYVHCIYFSITAMGKLVDSRRFSGALGGSFGFLEAAQGHMWGSFIRKLCLRHLFFFEYWGD